MHTKFCSRQYLTAAEKAAIVADYHRSGLSQRGFARRHGIPAANIHRWIQAEDSATVTEPGHGRANLVEVPNLMAQSAAGGTYRLHFPRGFTLEVARGFEAEELRHLAQLVQSL